MKDPVDSSDDAYGHGFTAAANREAYDREKEVFGDETNAGVSEPSTYLHTPFWSG